ncbi:MAG: phosphate ABC transporter permease subunit PstC [Chloroherpetonaceae bacterium]|nr:phosphate ABC transporter permease subunit PstC [Chloroherpetonaceae bacterium]MDW8437365.1 phosphate ABC transporter permease subunit PstC [Chloroherpetonaceae bacterium]
MTSATTAIAALKSHRRAKRLDSLAKNVILGVSLVSITIILLILIFTFKEAQNVFFDARVREEVLPTLFGANWQPVSDSPKYGVIPLFVGTLKTTLVAMLIAVPVGVLSALYSVMFAPKWTKEVLKPAVELVAGLPSVVIGFFALVVLSDWLQSLTGSSSRLTALVGGVAISLTAIPIIFTISEEALSAVPQSIKEASYALGATEWETAFYVVLPAAYPGIFAAVLLGLGRAFGETLIVLMATGNAAITSWSLLDSTRTLTATIGAEMAEVVFGDPHYNVLFLIGTFLFLFSMTLNLVAEFYVKAKLMKKFRGG